jgi:hypothetical protein
MADSNLTKTSRSVGGVVDRVTPGSTNQVLTKLGPGEKDYGWRDLPPTSAAGPYLDADGYDSLTYRVYTPADITKIANHAIEVSTVIGNLGTAVSGLQEDYTALSVRVDELENSLEDYLTATSGDARYVRKNTTTAQVLTAESLSVTKIITNRFEVLTAGGAFTSNSSIVLDYAADNVRKFSGGVFTGSLGRHEREADTSIAEEAEYGYFDIVSEVDQETEATNYIARVSVSRVLPRRIPGTSTTYPTQRTDLGSTEYPFKHLYVDNLTLGYTPLLTGNKITSSLLPASATPPDPTDVCLKKGGDDTAEGVITFLAGLKTNTINPVSTGAPVDVSDSIRLVGTNLSYSGGVFTGKAGYYTGLTSEEELSKQGFINILGAGTDGESCTAWMNVKTVLPRNILATSIAYANRRTSLGSSTYPFLDTHTDNLFVKGVSKISSLLLPTSAATVADPVTSLLGVDYKVASVFLPNFGKYKATYGGAIQYASGSWQWKAQGGPGTPGAQVENDGNRFKWTHSIGTEDYTLSILTVGQSLPEIYEKTADYVVIWFRAQGGSTITNNSFDITLHV